MGRVAAPYGVRGAIKVQPLSADPAALLEHRQWWLRTRAQPSQWQPWSVQSARMQGAALVAQVEGIDTRESAAALRGAEIGIPRDDLPELPTGEYYQGDLVGMAVENRDGVALGRVVGFAESGAHPLLQVVDEAGVERLIPWVGQYVIQVDVDAGRIDVDWPADY
ncbi:MAG TPA: ribosome maturation factor RimM [Casimicrobiaceae bacterium]|nr:ribosome maturation factor RimM [Casimicrobiaceae bacterium]